jgi:hypothetical protein
MFTAYDGHTRFAMALTVKGAFMITLGGTALLWSDVALVNAMMLASLLLASLGLYEIFLGLQARRLSRGWPIPLADGVASLGLAILSVTLTAVPLSATMFLSSIWLGTNGVLLGALALALWPIRSARTALVAWAAVDLLLAGMALTMQATIFTVLYAGAGYAIAFGVFQLVAGTWVWLTAAPEVAPTQQSRWRVTAPR